MTEDTLWTWLKRARKILGALLHLRRLENMVSTGDADTDGVWNGLDFAIELKACKVPARANTLLDYHSVTDAQVEWHSRRLAAGGASCFLLQLGANRYLIHGEHARQLQKGVTASWVYLYGRLVKRADEAINLAVLQRSHQ